MGIKWLFSWIGFLCCNSCINHEGFFYYFGNIIARFSPLFILREQKRGKKFRVSCCQTWACSQWKGTYLELLYCTILSFCVPFLLWMLQTVCCPEFHISFYPLNAYRGLLTLRRVSPFVAKNLCEKHKSGAGGEKGRGCHKNTKFWASFSKPLWGFFCSAGLGRNFERKAWKVGTNERRSLMGRGTKEQGRSPAGSNTETSVSRRTKRTQTFGGHMVFEISSQF